LPRPTFMAALGIPVTPDEFGQVKAGFRKARERAEAGNRMSLAEWARRTLLREAERELSGDQAA